MGRQYIWQSHTETGRTPAVRTGSKTADAELQLTGCKLILPPQYIRTDDNDFSMQIVVMGNGGTVRAGQGRHVNALEFWAEYLRAGFLGLFGQPAREELDGFAVVVTDYDLIVERRDLALLAVSTHITFFRLGVYVLPKNDFPVSDVECLNDLIASGHSFLIFHFLPPFFRKSRETAVYRRWRRGDRSAG